MTYEEYRNSGQDCGFIRYENDLARTSVHAISSNIKTKKEDWGTTFKMSEISVEEYIGLIKLYEQINKMREVDKRRKRMEHDFDPI